MTIGFISPVLPLGIGVPSPPPEVGRSGSPLPFVIGVPGTSEPPFEAVLPSPTITGSPGTIIRPDYKKPKKLIKNKILREDEELMQLVAQIVASGILE